MWEERFNTEDYVFGRAPAAFLLAHAEWLTPGASALSVADGEGRNSVFLAQKGLSVTAWDGAPSAIAAVSFVSTFSRLATLSAVPSPSSERF